MRAGKPIRVIVLSILVLLMHCSGSVDDTTIPPVELPARSPEDAAIALFQFASNLQQDSMVPESLVRADLPDQHLIAFLDGLETLRGAALPQFATREPFPDGRTVAIDAEVARPGNGLETWSIQVEEQPDSTWRVIWIQGPDTGWPPRKKNRDEGLSSSPPAKKAYK
jgi:hypothetical protein